MKAGDLLLFFIRIIFVMSSLLFLKTAFYSWDGYSFYIRFLDFLPELSLAFIGWVLLGIIYASAFWLIAYGIARIIRIISIKIHFEHITVFFFIVLLLLFVREMLIDHIDFSALTEMKGIIIIAIGTLISTLLLWFKRPQIAKIINEFDSRITPLVWIFIALLLLAIPFSVKSLLKEDIPAAELISDSSISSNEVRPNIILVTWDALNAQDMQVYGYDRPTTPFISEWAKDAFMFRRTYSASNWTTPASMSLMTGQSVWTHRVWYFAHYFHVTNYENNLPKLLKDSGYNIYGFVQNNFNHPDVLGIGKSFSRKDASNTLTIFTRSDNKLIEMLVNFVTKRRIFHKFIMQYPIVNVDKNIKKLILQNKNKSKTELNNTQSKANSMNNRTITRIPETVFDRFLSVVSEDNANQPFFAWLHMFPPHDPYIPPEPYMGVLGDEDNKSYGLMSEYEDEEQGEVDIRRKRYDELIMYCDEQFKTFIEKLNISMDLSNTIIVFSADHGENFSHGFHGHHSENLYEQVVHIPFLIKIPGNKGEIINMPTGQIDIAPTILDLAGISVPEWMDGRSLAPLLNGGSMEPQPVYATYLMENRSFGEPITKGTIAVWDEEYKLIYYLDNKESMLFNLQLDPDEKHDLSGEKQDIAQRLQALIYEKLAKVNKTITEH